MEHINPSKGFFVEYEGYRDGDWEESMFTPFLFHYLYSAFTECTELKLTSRLINSENSKTFDGKNPFFSDSDKSRKESTSIKARAELQMARKLKKSLQTLNYYYKNA